MCESLCISENEFFFCEVLRGVVDITFISLINSHKNDVTFENFCLKVSVKVVLVCMSVLCVLESV